MKGKFITLEGIEGSGRSTQINLLSEYLKKRGLEVEVYLQQGHTSRCHQIQKISGKASPNHELGVNHANQDYAKHRQLVEKIIPTISSGKFALCNYFCSSSFAYHHYGRELDIGSLNAIAQNFVKVQPDLTLILDIPVKVGQERKIESFNKLSMSDLPYSELYEFYDRIRWGYMKLARGNSPKIKTIDGTGTINFVHSRILSEVNNLLEE